MTSKEKRRRYMNKVKPQLDLSYADARAVLTEQRRTAHEPELRTALDRILDGHGSPFDAAFVAGNISLGAKAIAICETVIAGKKPAPKKAAKKAAKKKTKKAAKKKTKR